MSDFKSQQEVWEYLLADEDNKVIDNCNKIYKIIHGTVHKYCSEGTYEALPTAFFRYENYNKYIPPVITKKDLIPGKHLLETRAGDLYILIEDNILLNINNSVHWNDLNNYEENLLYDNSFCRVFDIMKVYTFKKIDNLFDITSNTYRFLIWKRKEDEHILS